MAVVLSLELFGLGFAHARGCQAILRARTAIGSVREGAHHVFEGLELSRDFPVKVLEFL